MQKPKSRKEELRDKRERAVEKERYEALDYVCRMHEEGARFTSVGQIATHFGRSRMWLYELMAKCLDKQEVQVTVGRTVRKGLERAVCRTVAVYRRKPGFRELIKRRKRGPQQGYLSPRTQAAADGIIGKKLEHPELGAAKINHMAGHKVSAPTARKLIYMAGWKPVTMKLGRKYKSFQMDHVNEMWQIDYVELGTDRLTGRKVESLSILDDHSRMILS